MRRSLAPLALALAAVLAGCATSSPDVISRNDAQRLSTVQDATVLSVRPVVVDGSQSGAGAVAGYVVGNMLFMGHLMPVLSGVAGGFAANYWYFNR